MKKVGLVAISMFVITSCAFGTGWTLTGSVASPAADARGICYDTPYVLSVLCDGTVPRIYNLSNPTQYLTLPIPSGVWGLTPGGGGIWVSNRSNNYIYNLTAAGSLLSSFQCPKNGPADLSRGYAGDICVAIPAENRFYDLSSAGSIVASYAGPGSYLTGIEISNPVTDAIFGDPQTHKVYVLGYGSFAFNNPVSVTGARTTRLAEWDPVVVIDGSSNYIYYYRFYGQQAVVPASLGKVKAVYR